MDTLRQDIRYGIRALLTHRTFAAAAILTLALGVGVNAAIFTVCRTVLFRPLPYAHPDRIVMLWERLAADGALQGAAPANFVDWRAQQIVRAARCVEREHRIHFRRRAHARADCGSRGFLELFSVARNTNGNRS